VKRGITVDKTQLKKTLASIGIAGLVAGGGVVGCASQKTQANAQPAPAASEAAAVETEGGEATASCSGGEKEKKAEEGEGGSSCGKGSCS
jgi:radical SAM modification target selenobiotic family peptide